jgi:putative hydrolase
MPEKFDFHLHTFYSDGRDSHIKMVEMAKARRLKAVAFTDHGPELIVGVPKQRVQTMLQNIEIARESAGIPVLASIEANITDANGRVDVDVDFVKNLDFLMAAAHYVTEADTYLSYPEIAKGYLRRVTAAIKQNDVKILAHPFFLYQPLLPYLSLEEIKNFLALAADRGVAMEVNSKYGYPQADFISLCVSEGVKLSVGSDAHSVEEVGRIEWALEELNKAGVGQEDLILHAEFVRERK